jgi:CheY-like chemotaxis protein
LVVEDNLLFASRVEAGLRAAGYEARFVTQISGLSQALKTAPVLVLVNIGSRDLPWPRLVALAKARRLPPHAPVVGYGPHVDLTLRQQALEAGCDAVVGRSSVANNLASLLERHAWKPDSSACDRPLPEEALNGIKQFNRREFYTCHDTIELVWVDEPGDVRLMYQGLLQVAVAFYHMQRGNWRGMVKMMARGRGKLLLFLPACQGVDLAGLLADVERCEMALRDLGPERMADFDPDLFPTIRVTTFFDETQDGGQRIKT